MTKIDYEKNEEDIQRFAENYFTYSHREKKIQIGAIIFMYIVIALIAIPLHKNIEEGLAPYLVLVLIVCIVAIIPGVRIYKKDRTEKIKKELSKQNFGVLGDYKTELTEEEIHVIYRPNNPKRERNMTNKWEEINYYSRDNDHFFIFMENPSFVYHIIAGDKANDVDHLLNRKVKNETKRE